MRSALFIVQSFPKWFVHFWMTFCKNSIRILCQIIFVNKHCPKSYPSPFKLTVNVDAEKSKPSRSTLKNLLLLPFFLFSGNHTSAVESVDYRDGYENYARTSVNFTIFERNLKFTAISVIYDVNWMTFVDFYIKQADKAYPVLDLANDASSWRTGKQLQRYDTCIA